MRRCVSLLIAAVMGITVLPVGVAAAAGGSLNDNRAVKCLVNRQLGRQSTTEITPADAAGLTELSDGNSSCEEVLSLAGLEELVSLRRLSFTYASNRVDDLSPLAGLTDLEEVHVSSASGITDITPLLGLTAITRLSLPALGVPDVSPLASLPNLRSLTLDSAYRLDFATLAPLDQVRTLSLSSTQAKDLTGIGNMANLEELDLSYSGAGNLTGLSTAPQLKRLSLNRTEVVDVSSLASLTSLTYLNLDSNWITNIDALASLNELNTLHLGTNLITDITPLSRLTALTELGLRSNKFGDLEPLRGLVNLRELNVASTDITDLSPLAGMRRIEQAWMGENLISDVSALSGWRNISLLNLELSRIRDFRPLRDVPGEIVGTRQKIIVPDGTTMSQLPTVFDPQGKPCPASRYNYMVVFQCANPLFDGVFETPRGGTPPTDPPAPTPSPSSKPSATPSKNPTQGPPAFPKLPFTVYNTPGMHDVNGRSWSTTCEPYSRTWRCRTEIWGTKITLESGRFVARNGWSFNNLTYLPAPRSMWKGNPLGEGRSWTAVDGRQWRTECDTPITGRNGCRSFVTSRIIVNLAAPGAPVRYGWKTVEVFNNMVQFG
ncbi:MAG: hypothetical protein Q4P15_13770 [Propionibacteriaceae bacterium]|nr:hypothetical protein [Propionibacteriaceae bacterium]